jgi:hypothetical protein
VKKLPYGRGDPNFLLLYFHPIRSVAQE